MYRKLVLTALAAATLAIGNAGAATATGNFTVSITIQNSCGITADDIAFGTKPDAVAQYDASGFVHVTCTGAGPITVGIGLSANDVNFTDRRMVNGANFVSYGLFSATAGAGNLLGDGTGPSFLVFNGTSTVGTVNTQVFAHTAGSQPVPDLTYSDGLVATVTY